MPEGFGVIYAVAYIDMYMLIASAKTDTICGNHQEFDCIRTDQNVAKARLDLKCIVTVMGGERYLVMGEISLQSLAFTCEIFDIPD